MERGAGSGTPDVDGPDVDVNAVLRQAILAPSIHNTQPWTFVVHPGNGVASTTIEVHADPERQLHELDPTGRQMHVSCGAAALHVQIGIRVQSRDCDLTLMPDPANPLHLATATVGGPLDPAHLDVMLAEAMSRRTTDRGSYDTTPLPQPLVADLEHGASAYGAWLRPLAGSQEEAVIAALLSHAERVELGNDAYRAELDRWIGVPPGSEEGVPTEAVLPPGHTTAPRVRRFLTAPDVGPLDARAPWDDAGMDRPGLDHPLIAVLGTDDDTAKDWVQAGLALEWLLLRLTVSGATASPLGQVIDLPGPRLQLRRELGLAGFPQMVLRMGYGHGSRVTGRRSVVDVTHIADANLAPTVQDSVSDA